MQFLDELTWRGLLHQTTGGDELQAHLASGSRIAYCGFDPTKDALTIGNYMPIKMLRHWQLAGHKPIVLMGGGTGLIGDPSGKDAERQLLSKEQVAKNIEGQLRSFSKVLDFEGENAAVIVNNADWLCELGFLDVLRDVGKYFSVNTMIQKDSVKDRLNNREQGISYTEFSYMILQAYDFLHLRRKMDCTIQIAGSDQYGNIVAGIDLIRRDMSGLADDEFRGAGITNPLVTASDGSKIGKTEKGAIWLTADRTSPYAFHQYWLNIPDEDAGKFLRWFTFLDQERIESIEKEHAEAPHLRAAQKALADAMTDIFHGSENVTRCNEAAKALFGGDIKSLDAIMLGEVFAEVPAGEFSKDSLGSETASLVEMLPQTELCKSKREAREFLKNGSVSINGEKVSGDEAVDRVLTSDDLLHGTTILLRRGKKAWFASRWS
ncbi:MAG TPA: tyrosine--tRNA ligase [Phycisphaerales bacterium]|nr:tyrosine--tRNA ligase [Phycisphaerales bacterium]HIB51146.1 tyrosine--tRNA ligase [Phycisphaerales bacterium]HIN83742.1 tyrosine--tRNA ligase [Phycisphaerales bacterium]HIO20459.1 tyrosine--tRNA ligase [Phycisphaerales bacterium]HIO52855.1 tyrosine--tRNA ligase [Phycisphaerales bacterium]